MSLSTPGEDRWIEQGYLEDGNSEGLIPGHAYTIIQIKEAKNSRLLNIRNPWGNFEWDGDWGRESTLWTDDMRQLLKPNLKEDDGTFWMSFEDILRHFYCANVCKVRNWDEVRIKGKFIKTDEIDDYDIEQVVSKWFYTVDIQERTKVVVTLHQEDERIEGVAHQRPYLDISLAILRKTGPNTEVIQSCTEFKFDRQIELEVELEPGTYIILPRTTGCTLRKPTTGSIETVPLISKYGGFTAEAKSCFSDIFRKFDMLLNREMSYSGMTYQY